MFKGFGGGLDKAKTFRPKRNHRVGTKRHELHKAAQATLGTGNLHEVRARAPPRHPRSRAHTRLARRELLLHSAPPTFVDFPMPLSRGLQGSMQGQVPLLIFGGSWEC